MPVAGQQRKETLSSRVSAQLRDDILRGQLAPGSKINLDRLRERFDISISPLREAVSRLAADGLVEFEDQRGYRVAPVSIENLVEITRLRAEFEVFALKASIENGDLEWESSIVRTQYVLAQTTRDRTDPDSIEAWETAHANFHLAMIEGCGLPLLLSFCQILRNQNNRYRYLFLRDDISNRDTIIDHRQIANATTARDAGQACQLLHEHIKTAGETLRLQMIDTMAAKDNKRAHWV
jgi:GntR family transcriptional regulator, carbon starvation induced regulator